MYLDPLAFADLARVIGKGARMVLVPFDGGRPACRALEHVIAAEKGRDSHVHVINVQEPTLNDRALLEASLRVGEEIVQRARGRLEAAGIRHSSEVAVGVPSKLIVERASRENYTAIVMGVRGAIARFFSGSVSDEVTRLAGVPVTRVR